MNNLILIQKNPKVYNFFNNFSNAFHISHDES